MPNSVFLLIDKALRVKRKHQNNVMWSHEVTAAVLCRLFQIITTAQQMYFNSIYVR